MRTRTPFALATLATLASLNALSSAGCASSSPTDAETDVASQDESLVADDTVDVSDIAFDGTDVTFAATPVRETPPLPPDMTDDTTMATDGATAADGSTATGDLTIGQSPGNQSPMSRHGGGVLARQNVYLIYYGDWSNARTRRLLGTFVAGFGHDDFNHAYLRGTHYQDAAGHGAISKGLHYGGSFHVRHHPYGRTLSNDDIMRVVHSVIDSGRAPNDSSGLYLVLAAPEVTVANESGFCGWHTSAMMDFRGVDHVTVQTDVKYGVIVNATHGCSIFGTARRHSKTPNGDFVADSSVTTIIHEALETATDPDGSGWWNQTVHNGRTHLWEISDKCAWNFQAVKSIDGAHANLRDRHANRWWLVQTQFVDDDRCSMGPLR